MAAALAAAHAHEERFDEEDVLLDEEDLELIEQAFVQADCDGSGALGEEELQRMWRMVFPQLPIQELREMADALYQDLDPNKDGHVSWPEFIKYFRGYRDWDDIDRMVHRTTIDRPPTNKEMCWIVMDMDGTEYVSIPAWVTPAKLLVAFVSNMFIMASVVSMIVESIPGNVGKGSDKSSGFYMVEAICIAFFTIEFMLRLLTCPTLRRYWTSFFTWIDVMAILPFYLGLVMGAGGPSSLFVVFRVVRLFRLLRLIRMLKMGRRFEAVQVLVIAIKRTYNSLLVSMVGVNSIGIVLVASLICVAEQDQASYDEDLEVWIRDIDSSYSDAGSEIQFQSIPESMWWAWVTLTTVGYGDMSPATGPGKAVASLTMLFGLVLMAFPLTLLSNSFGSTMDELQDKKKAKIRSRAFGAKLRKAKATRPSVNNSGALAATLSGVEMMDGGMSDQGSPETTQEERQWFDKHKYDRPQQAPPLPRSPVASPLDDDTSRPFSPEMSDPRSATGVLLLAKEENAGSPRGLTREPSVGLTRGASESFAPRVDTGGTGGGLKREQTLQDVRRGPPQGAAGWYARPAASVAVGAKRARGETVAGRHPSYNPDTVLGVISGGTAGQQDSELLECPGSPVAIRAAGKEERAMLQQLLLKVDTVVEEQAAQKQQILRLQQLVEDVLAALPPRPAQPEPAPAPESGPGPMPGTGTTSGNGATVSPRHRGSGPPTLVSSG